MKEWVGYQTLSGDYLIKEWPITKPIDKVIHWTIIEANSKKEAESIYFAKIAIGALKSI